MTLLLPSDGNSKQAYRLADGLALILLTGVTGLLLWQAIYFPEVNTDEAGAYLGLQLLRGTFSFPIDPMGPQYLRYYFFDCYPPVYYIVSAIIFKLTGFGILQARAATILFMISAGGLCYAIARRGAGPVAGLLALVLFIHIVPTRIYNWIINRPDIAAHFFTLAALAIMLPPILPHDRKAGIGRGLAVGMLFSCAMLSHYIALLAGPVIGGIVLWRASFRPWSSAFAWGALIGLLLVNGLFLWPAWPYGEAILSGLFSYGKTVGIEQRISTHVNTLAQNFPLIIYVIAPIALALALAGIRIKRIRDFANGSPFTWSLIFITTFCMVCVYPNNSLIWYYGLTYVYAGILMAAIAAGALLPQRGWVSVALLGGSALIGGEKLAYLYHRVDQRVEMAAHVPVNRSFEALSADEELLQSPSLAPIQFAFSTAGDHVMSPWVTENVGGNFQIDSDLAQAVPEMPNLSAFKSALLDHSRNVYDANVILAQAAAWRNQNHPHPLQAANATSIFVNQQFKLLKIMADPGHGTGNWTLWAGQPDTGEWQWPHLVYAAANAVENLQIGSPCHVETAQLERMSGRIPLWRLRLAITFPEGKRPLAVHAELASTSGAQEQPLGLLVYYPTQTSAVAGWASLRDRGVYPFLSHSPELRIATIAPTRRGGAETTSLILPPRGSSGTAVLDIITIEPATISRLLVHQLESGIHQDGQCSVTPEGRSVSPR